MSSPRLTERQVDLLSRLRRCRDVAESIGAPAIVGKDYIIGAIVSNETNNLAEADRMLCQYERNLGGLVMVRRLLEEKEKANRANQQAVKKLMTPLQESMANNSSHRPTPPPMGLTPSPEIIRPRQPLKIEELSPQGGQTQAELTAGQRKGLRLMDSSSPFVYRGLSEDGRQRMLEAHNRHRRKWQVYDSGVKNLQESPELTSRAQAYAEKLVLANKWEHSDENGRPDIGENVHAKNTSDTKDPNQINFARHYTYSPEEVVDSWYGEIQYFNYATLGDACVNDIGHFTQVISRRSTHVGFGVAKSARTFYEIWVCNYSPHGNMEKEFIDTSKITKEHFEAIKSKK
jgi:uncharacterized protein YkwD